MVFDGIENFVGKAENAGFHMFSEAFSVRAINSLDFVVKS